MIKKLIALLMILGSTEISMHAAELLRYPPLLRYLPRVIEKPKQTKDALFAKHPEIIKTVIVGYEINPWASVHEIIAQRELVSRATLSRNPSLLSVILKDLDDVITAWNKLPNLAATPLEFAIRVGDIALVKYLLALPIASSAIDPLSWYKIKYGCIGTKNRELIQLLHDRIQKDDAKNACDDRNEKVFSDQDTKDFLAVLRGDKADEKELPA